jgi:hypothetical protein
MLVVLILATVIPMAASADRDSATGTPSPVMATATPTPTVADEFNLPGLDKAPDPQALEEFRRELLGVLDAMDELVDEAPFPEMRELYKRRLQEQRGRVLELTAEEFDQFTDKEFDVLRTVSEDYKIVQVSAKYLKSEALAAKQAGTKEIRRSDQEQNSFPMIPTPTPVTVPTPGIVHNNDVADQVNEQLNDLWDPTPAPAICPADGYSTEVMFGWMVGLDAAKLVGVVLEAMCKEKTVTCPGVNAQDPIQCTISAIASAVITVLEGTKDGFDWCNNAVDAAMYQAMYQDTRIIHADLHEHDQNLTTRFNMTDHFLFDFRNLNLRLEIEANLSSPDDDPHAVFALPGSVCISTDLETLQQRDPFSPDVIAGCGLLEVVSDTVRSAIDMTRATGQDVNNAEAEFDAAIQHYNNGEWKLAYARFRKAYREAGRP